MQDEPACAPRATDRQVQEVQAGWRAGGLQLLHSCVSQLGCLPWRGQGGGEALEALVESPTFPWACQACFKKGVAAIQRAVLKPTGQRAAGAKRKRGKPKAKRK